MSPILEQLNDQQKAAIMESIDRNVVLMAAAGSGKTKTLVTRTKLLLTEYNVSPSEIMLITFTNKAVNEIQSRILDSCSSIDGMWIGTFHNVCSRIIRKFGFPLGIQNFTILDTDASKKLIKDILTKANMNVEHCVKVQKMISDMKNNLISSKQCMSMPGVNRAFANVYKIYNDTCWQRKTFDFDDMIIYALLLLENQSVQDWFHANVKYVMVDEAQDSNKGNFMLIDRIVGNNNVMLFGDYNQSIYGFRNALPKLLLDYSKTHLNTIDMKLEQNYRSTETIIKAANAVILNNGSDIQMFCSNERGDPIKLYTAENDKMEAQWVGIEIRMLRQMIGMKFGDFAIITRTRLQIRVLENIFRANGIPYVVHGNQGFYQRKEVMDLLAYCNLYINEKNVEALKRILKTLTGVGETTAEDILNKMEEDGVLPKNIFRHYVNTAQKISKKALSSLTATANLMEQSFDTCSSLVSEIFLSLDYRDKIMTQTTDEAKERLEVVDEFLVNVMECERDNYSFSISDTITYLMLMSESKKEDKETLDAVKVMTAHSSKGLEFPCVFIIGVEDGLFPHGNAIATGSIDSIQEERRLFYVSITRAMKLLYITSCKQRYRNDSMNTETCKPSRFIREIPSELTEIRYY